MERRSSANVNPTYQHLLHLEEDEFIDMDVSSATFFCCSIPSSPPNSKDFEFQMFAEYQTSEKQQLSTTSPADELFYKGKLLPLHLAPRLQMVQKLLERDDKFSESFSTADTATPFMSCQASPSPSWYVSGELEARFHFDSDCPPANFNNNSCNGSNKKNSKKYSWAKKLKLVKKLKASKDYLKSLFSISRSSCSDESKDNACNDAKYNNITSNTKEAEKRGHRRSFSDAIKRQAKTNSMTSSTSLLSASSASSSKSSSFSSAWSSGPVLKRSSSVGSEGEASIHGAIAHCKKSQGKTVAVTSAARKTVCDVEVYSLSPSRIAAESETQ